MENQFKFNLTATNQTKPAPRFHLYGGGNCQTCPIRARGLCNKNPPRNEEAYQRLHKEESTEEE